MAWLIGIDVGGTFTDLVGWDGTRVVTGKVASTEDQSEGVVSGAVDVGLDRLDEPLVALEPELDLRRRRAALAVLSHRRPQEGPDRGWISASLGEDGAVRAVYWWGAEPRDVATWQPRDAAEAAALREFNELAAWFEDRLREDNPDLDPAAWEGRIIFQEGLGAEEIQRLQ